MDKDIQLAIKHTRGVHLPNFLYLFLWSILDDKREMQTAFLLLKSISVMIPGAALVYLARSHCVGLLYVAVVVLFVGSESLPALHYYMHNRRTFKHSFMTSAVSTVAPLLHGIPVSAYTVLHLMMHHKHSNDARYDMTSTEKYQRDNALHFLWHWLDIWVIETWFVLPFYAFQRKRYLLSLYSALCMWSHFAAVFFLCKHNPCFGIWVVIVPTALTLFAISLHNWGQHMFVHPDSTKSIHPLHCSYNIINSTTNAAIFNDGYHAIHHNDPLVHWSDYPTHFRDNFDLYKREGCFYFKNIDSVGIALLCFRGRYDILSQHLTRLDGDRSEDDATFLRKRLAPIRRAV